MVIEKTPSDFQPRCLCGLDVAYLGDEAFAAAVLWDSTRLRVAETAESRGRVNVDYMPGLLGFREGRLMVSAALGIRTKADAFLVDGHGLAHPRRFGLACHVGLALNRPTIGIAKSLYHGRIEGQNIMGPAEALGKVVHASGKKYYVSVGHGIGLDDAVQVVRKCMVNDHPAPLREAHRYAEKLRGLS